MCLNYLHGNIYLFHINDLDMVEADAENTKLVMEEMEEAMEEAMEEEMEEAMEEAMEEVMEEAMVVYHLQEAAKKTKEKQNYI
jgi:hypothetical protein